MLICALCLGTVSLQKSAKLIPSKHLGDCTINRPSPKRDFGESRRRLIEDESSRRLFSDRKLSIKVKGKWERESSASRARFFWKTRKRVFPKCRGSGSLSNKSRSKSDEKASRLKLQCESPETLWRFTMFPGLGPMLYIHIHT